MPNIMSAISCLAGTNLTIIYYICRIYKSAFAIAYPKDITGRVAGIVAVIILASFIVLGSPRVQTAITHGLTRKLNCSLNGNATVGSIAIKPFNSFTSRTYA